MIDVGQSYHGAYEKPANDESPIAQFMANFGNSRGVALWKEMKNEVKTYVESWETQEHEARVDAEARKARAKEAWKAQKARALEGLKSERQPSQRRTDVIVL